MLSKILPLLLIPSLCWAGVRCDGTNDYVTYGDVGSLDGQTQLTVAAWVYFDVDTVDSYIGSKYDSTTYKGFLFLRDDVAGVSGRTDTCHIVISDQSGVHTARVEGVNNACIAGQWYHVAFTAISGSSTGLRLYIDGVEDANSPASLSSFTYVMHSSNPASLYAGAGSGGTTSRIDGNIAEFAVWNKVLTSDEISMLAKSRKKRLPLQIQPSNLLLYSPYDEYGDGSSITSSSLYDMSGNGRTATATGSGIQGLAEQVLTY